jgi:LysM repeat protein
MLVALIVTSSRVSSVHAKAPAAPRFSTAYELIDAVNNYRAQNGLPAYTVNSILMGTAQGQADYMASTGTVTHTGPGGISFPDRLIAAGYSFVFRSENIISGSPSASGWSLVTSPSWADDLHQHTMLSPDLREIGAGVAVSGGLGYYVIDCGGAGGGAPSYTAVPGFTPVNGGGAATAVVVVPNTPKPDGSVFHVVQPGDALWSIAIAYKTTSANIKALNNLTSDLIYPGDTLLIFPASSTATPAPTATRTSVPTATPFVFWTVTSSPEPTATPIPASPVAGGSGMIVVGVIIIFALLAAGALTAAGARKDRKSGSG